MKLLVRRYKRRTEGLGSKKMKVLGFAEHFQVQSASKAPSRVQIEGNGLRCLLDVKAESQKKKKRRGGN